MVSRCQLASWHSRRHTTPAAATSSHDHIAAEPLIAHVTARDHAPERGRLALGTQRGNQGSSCGRLVRALRTSCILITCRFLTARSLTAEQAIQEVVNRDSTWGSDTASNAIREGGVRTHQPDACVQTAGTAAGTETRANVPGGAPMSTLVATMLLVKP